MTSEVKDAASYCKNISCHGKREEFYCFLHYRIFGAACTRFTGEVKRHDFQQEKIKKKKLVIRRLEQEVLSYIHKCSSSTRIPLTSNTLTPFKQ